MSTTEEKEQAVAEEKQEATEEIEAEEAHEPEPVKPGTWRFLIPIIAPFPSWLGYLPATSLWQKTAAD
jgi:hypothetical protein